MTRRSRAPADASHRAGELGETERAVAYPSMRWARTTLPPAPPGFRTLRVGRCLAVLDARLEEAVRAQGLLEEGAVDGWIASAPGARGRAATAVIPLPGLGQRLHLRRLQPGGWLRGLRGEWRGSLARPLAELALTARLRAVGAPVPRPALVLAERRGPWFRAALGTLYEEATLDGVAFLEAEPEGPRLLRAAAAAGRALRQLHAAGALHADLHLKNLLVRESPSGTRVLVVDLDRSRWLGELHPRQRLAQLARLHRSLVKRRLLDRIGPRGCAVLLRQYLGDDAALRRALRAERPRLRRRLALHTWGYRLGERLSAGPSRSSRVRAAAPRPPAPPRAPAARWRPASGAGS